MLTLDDKQLYYQVARDLYTFKGSVVDLGAFVGATAVAMATGIVNNPLFECRKMSSVVIHSYDIFKLDYGAFEHLNWYYNGARVYREGDDFLDVFLELTKCFSSFIQVNRGDIANASYNDSRPIEILSVDICKSRQTTDAVFRKFFPRLMPGAYILQQDFIHPWHPYLHTAIGYFADSFQVVHENAVGATVLHRLVKPINACMLADFSRTCLADKSAWLPLMDRAFAQLRSPRSLASLQPARTLLMAEVEGLASAQRYAQEILQRPDLTELDRTWMRQVLDYAARNFNPASPIS